MTKTGLMLNVFIAGMGLTAFAAEQTPPPAPASTGAALSPEIQFATPIYDFGKAKVGEPVKHDFIFTNTGQAVLEITEVHPGCGCTTAGNWTHNVEPGKTGTIPIQYNASGGSGPVTKTVSVTSNAKNQPGLVLQIKGILWKPVDVSPTYAIFNVTPDAVSNATSVVRIINNEATPLTLSAPENNSHSFAVELKTKQPGKEFELIVKPVPPLGLGTTQGLVTLKTSSTNAPVISVNMLATLKPTLVAVPPSISLPASPSTNKVSMVVRIRNNGSRPLVLSDPTVNAAGVDAQIKEIEPGRYSTLTVTFPPEFAVPTGKEIKVSIKTDNPQIPVFTVPVVPRQHASR